MMSTQDDMFGGWVWFLQDPKTGRVLWQCWSEEL